MTTDELLVLTRTLLRDRGQAQKWSDEDIVRYLNEALEKVSRVTLSLVVSNEPLALQAEVGEYVLENYIQHVFRVQIDGMHGPLAPSTDNWTPVDDSLGQPARYTLDGATQTIRFYPAPREDIRVVMRVARFPEALSADALDRKCELPERYQMALPDWAAHRCFTHDDADGRNDQAAQLAKGRFDDAVREYKRDGYRFRTGSALRVGGNPVRKGS